MKKIFLSLLFATTCLGAWSDNHFITDTPYRNKVESVFKNRMQTVGKQFFDTKSLKPTLEQTEALEFLYAYMPLADVTDYPTSFYRPRTVVPSFCAAAACEQRAARLVTHRVLPRTEKQGQGQEHV